MATITPTYNAPVNGPRIRRLWNDVFGINGVLSGFGLVSISSSEISLDSGSFISNGCVVESDAITISIPDNAPESFYVCAYFDHSIDEAGVVISEKPDDKWVIIGRVRNSIWYQEDDVTSFNLRDYSDAHISDSDAHIDVNAKEAFDGALNPSKINRFLTESDTHIGTEFSPSDMQLAVNACDAKNNSSILYDGDNDYMKVFSVGLNNSGYISPSIVANGKIFFNIRNKISESLYSVKLFNLSDAGSDIEKYVVNTSDLEASICFIGNDGKISDLNRSLLFAAIRIEGECSSIESVTYNSSGIMDTKTIESPSIGQIITIGSPSVPSLISDISLFEIRMDITKGSTVEIIGIYESVQADLYKKLNDYTSELKSFRVTPVSGSYGEELSCFISTDTRTEEEIVPFTNSLMSSDPSSPEISINSTVCIRPSLMMESFYASDWPDKTSGYCTSSYEESGAMVIVGGYNQGLSYMNKAYGYSEVSDSYITINIDSIKTILKASSVTINGKIICTGGEDLTSKQSVEVNVLNGSVLSLSDMNYDRIGHGFQRIDTARSLAWCGKEFPDPSYYNRSSDTWSTISSFTNVDYEIKSCVSYGGYEIKSDLSKNNIQKSIYYGSGRSAGTYGSRINISNMTPVALGSSTMRPMLSITATMDMFVISQGKDDSGTTNGAYDIISDTDITLENIPVTGVCYSGSCVDHDNSLSYGPTEYAGVFDNHHYRYSTSKRCWMSGFAMKWEYDW